MPVPPDFHARYCAQSRRYRYLLLNRGERPGLLQGKVGWCHRPLDVEAMREAAACLPGTHDFSSFRAAECQAKSPVRTLHSLEISCSGELVIFDCHANAFLHHMVRNLVGALVYVGMRRQAAEWMGQLLQACDRREAAPTFSPDGLYLVGVEYANQWGLPQDGRIIAQPPLPFT
jgi:tRNA pseudouridine38-40 synthase